MSQAIASSVSANSFANLMDDKWREVETENFRLLGNITEAKLKDFAMELEQFRYILTQATTITPTNVPRVTMILMKDKSDFRVLYSDGRRDTAAFWHNAMSNSYVVAIAGTRRGKSIGMGMLYRAYSSHLLRATGDMYYPLWYETGLIEYLSTTEIIDSKTFRTGGTAKSRVGWIDRINDNAFSELMANNRWGGTNLQKVLAESWLAIRYLLSHPEYSEKTEEYIRAVNEGVDDPVAFEQVFGVSVEKFNVELKKYHKRGKYNLKQLSLTNPIPTPDINSREMEKNEVVDVIAEYLYSTIIPDETYTAFMNAAGNETITPQLLALKVEKAQKLKNWSAAEEALKIMAEKFPNHQQTHLQTSHIAYARAINPETTDPAERTAYLVDSINALKKIFSSNKKDVHAIVDMGDTFRAYKPDSDYWVKLYETAYHYNPANVTVGKKLVHAYYDVGNYQKSYDLLQKLAYGADVDGMSTWAKELHGKLMERLAPQAEEIH